jgi:DNA-binding transcriptional LysR family regulator
MAREVLEGRLDLAFVALPDDGPAGLELIALAREPIMLAVPPGHPLAERTASSASPAKKSSSTSPSDGASAWPSTDRSARPASPAPSPMR